MLLPPLNCARGDPASAYATTSTVARLPSAAIWTGDSTGATWLRFGTGCTFGLLDEPSVSAPTPPATARTATPPAIRPGTVRERRRRGGGGGPTVTPANSASPDAAAGCCDVSVPAPFPLPIMHRSFL